MREKWVKEKQTAGRTRKEEEKEVRQTGRQSQRGRALRELRRKRERETEGE